MTEATLRTSIVKALASYHGGIWFVTHADGYGEVGIPDIVGVCKGKFFGLEVKLPGKEKTLKPWQGRMLARIYDNGGCSKMVTSVNQALEYVALQT